MKAAREQREAQHSTAQPAAGGGGVSDLDVAYGNAVLNEPHTLERSGVPRCICLAELALQQLTRIGMVCQPAPGAVVPEIPGGVDVGDCLLPGVRGAVHEGESPLRRRLAPHQQPCQQREVSQGVYYPASCHAHPVRDGVLARVLQAPALPVGEVGPLPSRLERVLPVICIIGAEQCMRSGFSPTELNVLFSKILIRFRNPSPCNRNVPFFTAVYR